MDDSQRNLIVKEIEIIQSRYDKYEGMIMQNRQLAVALVSGVITFAVSNNNWLLLPVGCVGVIFLLLIEYATDRKFLSQLRTRSRTLRSVLNDESSNIKYMDFFNSYARNGQKTFYMYNWDRWIFYIGLFSAPVVVYASAKM